MWHYVWQNQQVGPVPETELRQYFAEGRLPLETLVWSPGMAQWAPAGQIPAFQPGQAAPAPQGQAPQAQQQAGAAAMPGAAPGAPLSPTEVIFLHADRFASPAGMLNESVELLHVPQKVKAGELGQAIMATAFLATEQAGAITLAVREQKALFGLKTNKVLEVGRGAGGAQFPPDSFEASIAMLVQQGQSSVSEIVYQLLLEDSPIPAGRPYWLIQGNLVRKGMIYQHEKKGMLGVVTYSYSLSEQAVQLGRTSDPTPWLQLLGHTQQARNEIWAALASGIQSGFTRRKEIDNDSSGPDLDFD